MDAVADIAAWKHADVTMAATYNAARWHVDTEKQRNQNSWPRRGRDVPENGLIQTKNVWRWSRYGRFSRSQANRTPCDWRCWVSRRPTEVEKSPLLNMSTWPGKSWYLEAAKLGYPARVKNLRPPILSFVDGWHGSSCEAGNAQREPISIFLPP